MKIRCDRMDLVDRLSAILGIVAANAPKPICGDFLLSADAGNLTVEATDLEITGRIVVHKVEVARDGQLALPSGRLLAILKEISEDYVEIEALEDIPGAELNSSGFRFKILGHRQGAHVRDLGVDLDSIAGRQVEARQDLVGRLGGGTSRAEARRG